MTDLDQFKNAVKNCIEIKHCAWHGSLAEGQIPSSITDVDIIICINGVESQFRLEERMEELRKLKSFLKNYKKLKVGAGDFETSFLIIPEREIGWDIVKNVVRYNFFKHLTEKSHPLLKGGGVFKPEESLRHNIAFMNQNKGLWDQYAAIIQRTQVARSLFCRDELGSDNRSTLELKALCRLIDNIKGGSQQERGYDFLRNEIPKITQLSSGASTLLSQHPRYTDAIDALNAQVVMEIFEACCYYSLVELEKLLPRAPQIAEIIIKEYMCK